MKLIPHILTVAVLLAGSASAQTTYLYENHNTSVPGPGWTQVKINSLAQGWIQSGDLRAWHEDEFTSTGTTDDRLISPVMDLSAAGPVYVHFNSQLNWADYLANHPSGFGDGENDLWVSTDGGATWTEVWTDTRLLNTTDWTAVDISSYAGNASVQVALRFYGTYAQEWWVDEVVVTSSSTYPANFTLAKSGVCGGPMTLSTSNGTANGSVALLYGAAGTFTQNNPSKPCLGITLNISAPTLGAMLSANSSGVASLTFNSPSAACGKTVQAINMANCTKSNAVVL